jgi:hypothetical protein
VKQFIYLIILLLLCSSVLSVKSNTEYDVYTFEKCNNIVKVKLNADPIDALNKIRLYGCKSTEEDNLWHCQCEDNYTLKVKTQPEVNAIYDFQFEWYMKPITEPVNFSDNNMTDYEINVSDYRRLQQINNVKFESNIRTEKEPDQTFMIVIIAGVTLIFVGIIVFLIWYFVFKDDTEEEVDFLSGKKKKIKKEEPKEIDEDIQKMFEDI